LKHVEESGNKALNLREKNNCRNIDRKNKFLTEREKKVMFYDQNKRKKPLNKEKVIWNKCQNLIRKSALTREKKMKLNFRPQMFKVWMRATNKR
jgi:hypothetical protein